MCTAEREVEVSGEVDRDEKSGSERTRFHLDPNHDVGTTSPAGDAQTHHRCPTMSSRDTEARSQITDLARPKILMCVGLSGRGFRT